MARKFSQMIATLRGGVIDDELGEQVSQVVQACQRNGGKGAVSVTITIEPRGLENKEMHVTAKIGMKAPQNPDLAEPSIRFAVRGDLVADDPDQGKLQLDERREQRRLEEAARAAGG